jgi:predicted  nucleic acid-binding Zn-ribbon protein
MTAKIDWESLAHKLQEALSKEMKEVERLKKSITELNDSIEELESAVDDYDGDNIRLSNEVKGKNAIISYLEHRLYIEMKKAEDKNWEIPF